MGGVEIGAEGMGIGAEGIGIGVGPGSDGGMSRSLILLPQFGNKGVRMVSTAPGAASGAPGQNAALRCSTRAAPARAG
ncbi:hypothetical protein H4W31_003486 [Plantactinospora soyae]|uniref:Uncharacterized protein n=1 Tax=Plantactinospora soyae TaxID=1544732 RepID=A0A927M461_9ACTN|nr:hypothetical protein [Plantactinospora soyae]